MGQQPARAGSPMSTSLVSLLPPELHGDDVVLRGQLHPPARPAAMVEFRVSAQGMDFGNPPIRPFLFAFLPPAMRLGTPLRLPRPIDPITAANVMEWQEAVASWHPSLRVVPIQGDVAPNPPGPAAAHGALTAFSGGVDSCFTVLRHTDGVEPARYRRTSLRTGVMVHGFDIPLDQPDVFESAWNNSAALLQSFGLDATRAQTNVRRLQAVFGCNWETEAHGIWLAAVLACHEHRYERVLIPSTYAYPKMKFPWASNPVTDPLFSSDRVAYWHDGAAFTKLTKVRALAVRPVVAERIRVCWQGARLERNCGRCFKCVATQVCFWLSGVPAPGAFPAPAQLADVARLPVKNEENAYLIRSLRTAARETGREELADALGQALRRAAWTHAAKSIRRKLRRLLPGSPASARSAPVLPDAPAGARRPPADSAGCAGAEHKESRATP